MIDANAEELINIAREIGADIVEGYLLYSSDTGSYQINDIDISEHLTKYRNKKRNYQANLKFRQD